MADILGGFGSAFNIGQNIAQSGFDAERRNRLAELASQAYSTPTGERNALLGQMAAVDPASAQTQEQAFATGDDRRNKTLVNMAKLLTSAPEQYREGIYQRMKPSLGSLGLSQVPDTYTPEVGALAEQLVSAWGGSESGANVQSRFVDAQGNVMALMRDGSVRDLGIKADPNMQIIEGAGGFYGVNKRSLEANPVQVGAPGVPRAPGEVPFSIDPRLPPEVQQAIRSNPDAGSAQGITSLPMQGGGGQLQAAPDQPSATFSPLNSDEIRTLGLPAGTVAQRNLQTGQVDIISKPPASAENKPMPVSALRLLQDSREKLSIAEGNIQSLSKIGQQIANGTLNLGLLANAASRARNFTGSSTPESRNFALMMSSLEKLRNDSLRLNNGVQTEGDAQRAWNELMTNLNDERVVADQIARIISLNERAARLHQENMDGINANYGPGMQAGSEQEAADSIDSLLEMYR